MEGVAYVLLNVRLIINRFQSKAHVPHTLSAGTAGRDDLICRRRANFGPRGLT